MAVILKRTTLVALWLALFACLGKSHAAAPEQWPSGLPHEFFTAELATTLDADNQADWIRAYPCRGPDSGFYYCVRVAVSQTHSTQTIVLKTNAKRVRVVSHDVDGDQLQDVLVMSADDGTPLGVWINDGRGGFKQSDAGLYPKSVWHEDPLLCPSSPSERNPLAAMNGIQNLYLEPFALEEPLLDAEQPFCAAQVPHPRSACHSNHSGRAPPVR
jgi:hypothetical protein